MSARHNQSCLSNERRMHNAAPNVPAGIIVNDGDVNTKQKDSKQLAGVLDSTARNLKRIYCEQQGEVCKNSCLLTAPLALRGL
ncbi:hypothetical protein NDU88_001916 [Pleurodeles waltl]|uniref:Uncharacterized protein n=1 Tax=Pleurodeles waltl TaxID=8319 RepID=A0AAV7M9I7_PLEWA|nr:hypothetical protein NDU88_001916 [Pleurodeles waltl]